MSLYCVVSFPSENTIEVVSSKWLTNNNKKCHWPVGVTGERVKILIKSHSFSSNIEWQLFDCKLLKQCESYERARVAVVKAVEGKSQLETTGEENLGRGKRQRGISSYSERNTRTRVRRRNLESESDVGSRGSVSVVSSLLSTSFATNALVGNPIFHINEVEDLNSSIGSPVNGPSFVLAGSNQESQKRAQEQLSSSLLASPSFVSQSKKRSITIESYEQAIGDPFLNGLNEAQREERSAVNATRLDLELQKIREDIQKFQSTVTRQLLKVLENQEEILRRSAENPSSTTQDISSPVELPLSSVTDFEKFNDWLLLAENASLFCAQLVVVGGKNIRMITKRVLEVLLTNDVAKLLSLTGKGRKSSIGFLDENKSQKPILKLLYKAVRSTKHGEGATQEEINQHIRDWLKGASDRAGGREARRRQQCHPGNLNGSTQNEVNSEGEGIN